MSPLVLDPFLFEKSVLFNFYRRRVAVTKHQIYYLVHAYYLCYVKPVSQLHVEHAEQLNRTLCKDT